MDVVIGCLDNRQARLSINGKCYMAGCPWVDAGIGQLNGQVRVFMPPDGVCYECSFTDDDYQQMIVPCNRLASMYAAEGKIPTTPTIASIVAGVQVQETLKLLAYDNWRGRSLVGREFIYNGTVENVSIISLPRRDNCPAHRTLPPGQLVQLMEVDTHQTTFGQLLQAMENYLGPGATLLLNFDLALSVSCEDCGKKNLLLKPAGKLFREDLICPQCGREGLLDPARDLTARVSRAHAHVAILRDLPLAGVNIPPLDLVAGVGAYGSTAYFVLRGDAAGLLGSVVRKLSPCQ
jgi:adenylyltransferase/sulfurtransferase